MFNLEQAIAEWRREMLAAGIKTPVPLEELESHLREDVEKQMQSGLNAQLAFENSARQIGQAKNLKDEFGKTCGTKGNRLLWLGRFGLAGILTVNLGGILVFHKSSSVFFAQQWWSVWFPSYMVWITFAIIGGGMSFAKRRQQRKTIKP